ncbi:hypothetical protein CAI21_05595 [Alkalilimnicola ehrlichii]|uniref:AraC effector-binding domain-containing protein n=1 Tax=Alkalilimnicola ehrlichii TaxID=351052 RepID=A0A3E0X0B9_9GAMM|nr:GyrI-like domain-containing protein [Alkalilimnicola ehrlichii]RFA30521.1 hypothetical protein CAI21_05595 [Alkalilimnicola ehrlichii]RFA38069.1 hypothetical protein CAL65_06965 [Alkalilimnicola ehrlichii]
MPPTLKEVSAFQVAGISVRTTNADESQPETARLPGLWERFYAGNVVEKIPDRKPDSPVYGVYSQYESDLHGAYTVTAGVAVPNRHSDDYQTAEVESGLYLVFAGKGKLPEAIIDTWSRVWAYFDGDAPYKRRYSSDFECYLGPEQVAIYIAVVEAR